MNKGFKLGIVLALIFIVLLGIVGLSYFGIQQTALSTDTCSGGQILSISSASKTFSNELGKDVIRVVFSTLPSSECIDIKWNEADLEKKLKDSGVTNFDVTKNSIGDIILTKSQKQYQINEDSTKVYRNLIVKDYNTFFSGIFTCTDNFCKEKNPNLVLVKSNANNANPACSCVYYEDKGISAKIASSSSYAWETTVKIDGISSTTLSNNKLSSKIGSNVFVKWSGNQLSNNALDSVNRDAYKPYSDNQFRLVDAGLYTDLNQDLNLAVNNLKNCNNLASTCTTQINAIKAFIAKFDTETKDQLNSWASSETLVESATISSNKLIVDLSSPIVYPTFTLDIEASKIGIYVSSGKPDVSCPSNVNDLISGQQSTATFNIKNIGGNSGSFDYRIDCNKGSQVLSPTAPRTIGAGSTQNVNIKLGLTVANPGSEKASCTFTATELNTLVEDSCSFSYTATKQSQCIEGTQTCETGNSELWTCNADGSYDKVTCDNGCYINDSGLPECKGESEQENDSGTCKKWFGVITSPICLINEFFFKFKLIFSLLLGVAVTAGIYFLYVSIVNQLGKKENILVGLILGLIFGIGVGFLAFTYFFLGLLSLIVIIGLYLLIKAVF